MTTCTRCGQISPLGTSVCPRCGAPLVMSAPGGVIDDPDGGNLPPWLRALRAETQASREGGSAALPPGSMPPRAAAPRQGAFSAGSLLSDDALPNWLTSGAGGGPPEAGGAWNPGGQPSATPPPAWPAQGGQFGANAPGAPGAMGNGFGAGTPAPGMGPNPAGAMSAAALFDEAALPEWLRASGQALDSAPAEYGAPASGSGGSSPFGAGPAAMTGAGGMAGAAASPPYAGGARTGSPYLAGDASDHMPAQSLLESASLPTWLGGPSAPQAPAAPMSALGPQGMAANTLIDERSLPAWMREEAPNAPDPRDVGGSSGTVSRWLAAPETEEQLPPWLNQVYSAAQVPRLEPVPPVPAPWSGGPGEIPASRLYDNASAPEWMRQAGAGPSSGMPAPSYSPLEQGPPSARAAESGAGPGFSASDLIDPDAMPPWAVQGPPVAPSAFTSAGGWATPAQAPQTPAGGAWQDGASTGMPTQVRGGASGSFGAVADGFTAASLVDDGNLPPWLGADGGAGGAAMAGADRPPLAAPLGEAELPPWLQGGGAARGPAAGGAWPGQESGAPGAEWPNPVGGGWPSPAPAADWPSPAPAADWPQESPAAGGYPGGGYPQDPAFANAGGPPMDAPWGSDDAMPNYGADPGPYGDGGYGGPPNPYDAGGMPPVDAYGVDGMNGLNGMAALDPASAGYEDDLDQHYADRFGDEGRGAPARFGYEFDHPVGGGRGAPPREHAAGGGKKAGGGRRKRFWGRN